MDIKLSIIVPVYNVEEYVEKCLRSIEYQDVPNDEYEIIVLNDGSTDNSLSIVKEFATKHNNIKVFSHPNIGLSGTRNRGLRESVGEYVWFVDSDDWIEKDCLSQIIDRLSSTPDVLCFSGMIPEGGRLESPVFYDMRVNSLETLFYYGLTDGAPFYIYRRNFLLSNNFFFREGIKHEDTLFTPITMYSVKSLVFYRKPVYHMLLRPGSITTVVDFKRVKDLAEIIQILYNFFLSVPEGTLKKGAMNKIAHRLTEMMNYGMDNGREGQIYINNFLCHHPEYWTVMKNAIDKKPRIIYYAIKLSPLPFVMTYKIMYKIKALLK